MTRVALWPRLVAVLVALLLGIYYIGFVILGWSFTATGYDVKVEVPTAAGVFVGSSVTYRGVQVGRVDEMTPTAQDVDLTLHIENEYKIPANSSAHVRMLSALGEQYVDLVPASAQGPDLHDGSVIPVSRTTVPLQIGVVLHSAKDLLSSIDPADLDGVEDFLSTAFSNVTPQLKQLIATGKNLTDALIKAQHGTTQLIVDGKTVLEAGNDTGQQLETYVAALDTISKQFVTSDTDFNDLLANGGGALEQVEQFLNTETQPFKDLLAGAGAAGSVVTSKAAAVQALFAVLPTMSENLAQAAERGALSGRLFMNNGQPVCSYSGAGVLALPGVGTAQGSPSSCAAGPGLQLRGPDNAPGGG